MNLGPKIKSTDRLTIAYGGVSEDYSAPGDRRRFAGYAKRAGIQLMSINDSISADAAVLTLGSDISRWREIKKKHGILILDIVDAYLDESELSLKRNFRGVYKSVTGQFAHLTLNYPRLIEEVVSQADAVVCASKEQQKKLRLLNANVHAIVDCFEELRSYTRKSQVARVGHFIMWEGFPENLKHLRLLGSKRNAVWHDYSYKIVTLEKMQAGLVWNQSLSTSIRLERMGISHQLRPWNVKNLIETSNESDLAVIPLDICDKLAWNKSENKLLGLWTLGVPVLVSPTPSYSRVAHEAEVKNCVVSDGNWGLALSIFMNDPVLRLENINNGRAYAEKIGSTQAIDMGWGKVRGTVGLS